MNIAELLGLDRTETVEGDWQGKPFTVTFYPARQMTPVVVQGIDEGLSGRPLRLADALGWLLAEWSLDWNGEPFPPVAGNIALLPWEFVLAVADLVVPETKTEAKAA